MTTGKKTNAFFVNLKTTERTFTRTKIKRMGKEREEQIQFYLIGRNCFYTVKIVFSCFKKEEATIFLCFFLMLQ